MHLDPDLRHLRHPGSISISNNTTPTPSPTPTASTRTKVLHPPLPTTLDIEPRQMCPDDTGIFSEYKIESQQEDRIGFEVEASLLTLALKSSDTGEQTVIKLRKKDGQAVLSFEIITQVCIPSLRLTAPFSIPFFIHAQP